MTHKITELNTEWFSVCPNVKPKFRAMAIFKSYVKNNNSNKSYVCPWSYTVPEINFFPVQQFMSCLRKTTWIPILTFNRPPRSRVWFYTKNVLLKVVLHSKTNQHTKCHGASFTAISEVWKSITLEWLKVRDKKVWCRGHLQWHVVSPEFHISLIIHSKVIRKGTWIDGHRDRWTDRMVSHKPLLPY
jgi:hypothetical protein